MPAHVHPAVHEIYRAIHEVSPITLSYRNECSDIMLLPFRLDNYESCPSWFSQFFTFASWSYLQDAYVQISPRSISDPSARSEKHPVNHGAPSDPLRHVGDLGNIEVGEDGVARIDGMDHYLSLVGVRGAIGRALVIHAKPDDLGRGGTEESLKTGSSGERVACGVIGFL
ncbi:Superoxide dismutase [Cu-Zn] [Trachymyrmex septentrionalis]|uniref:superoxide dismutase n=1 Tax=Trachymyrmex septentrionalis TaxID=34720 RepID=A0A151JXR9_9HYME|nr:Superoxide dismutase [Cu-Zn] [Trachymyrmex septentrionalis]